ncbi:MAG: phospho-N-acetylmuramoyl-pentapeptide-transferase [Candidatus Cloacimonetes bacterium]|nr:phospho-N-acetylmuramoyl-pentapeptide-transferase [Candidatus Cloacimonadota bacterium]
MFYHLFSPLVDKEIFGYSIFNVFQYVTFRAIAAFITALVFSLFLGPKFIRLLKKHQAVETIGEDVPSMHKQKQGTPTMGGLIVLSGLLIASLLWNNLTNSHILIMFLTTIWLGCVGFLDDYLKNFRHAKKGLIAKYKLLAQVALGLIIAAILYYGSPDRELITKINLPFLKDTAIQLGWVFIPFVIFMIVGTSNAVNLTDGLDGLAGGTIAFSGFALGAMAYFKGHYHIANYLNLEFIQNAGELTIFTSALIGTIMGFLWYNSKPAEIFLGDTGSLSLGGILAVLAILLREEVFFAIAGGIFVAEAFSVIIQRYYFKYTKKKFGKGKRVFLCAPIHHHFELKGIKEEKIVVRFWIIAALLVAVALGTIKLR